ncbi:acetaldehyde dehydrogenase (acetylating) [Mycobacterium sp. shizuoka-1]|uniref:acetaldehyde dehydrogenase (acetylating) n=1 Tax=Mycobacterium sp. shizuoka-1 TaxID=2039281 RepID=UPI000C065F58|nr:acetaldehyde dehydrogenase (acetylating) [Mycobacterium sp. shizuoka-1]GAY14997.1 Acetaldehyde dehydrogenase [Mycobacterium sp. shizuoka-1]
MSTQRQWPVAIIGSGNIGTDLMVKVLRSEGPLVMGAMVGIDPNCDGLARAKRMNVPVAAGGVDELMSMPEFADIALVFDASTAPAHERNWAMLKDTGRRVLDLTPAAIGPYCVPVVNVDGHLDAANLNMVTCAGQATVPIVAAVADVGAVSYAETVSSISSRSAGPGTRATLDEFTETTAAALRTVGGARRARALLILNPADPPMMMRNTVYCLLDGDADHAQIEQSVESMADAVTAYVPGYRLRQRVQFETFTAARPLFIPETGTFTGTRVTVLLEVTGAADHLPAYAGNLDIMTAAALSTAQRIAAHTNRIAGVSA